MYMAGLHNNHFRKNHNWMPNIYKTKSHKEINRNKLRFKTMPIWGTPEHKSLSFIKAGICGSRHYLWNTKNHKLMKAQHKYGFKHIIHNKYLIYDKLRKDGRHNFHKYEWMDFHLNTNPIISIRDRMDYNYRKMNNKMKYNRSLRKYRDWDKSLSRRYRE